MKDLDQDQILHYTADELAAYRDRLNKEIERRNGKDINIKKVRAQLYQLAKALGCEWISESYTEDSQQDADNPRRRGRRRKTEEIPAGAAPTNLQEALPAGRQATPNVANTPVEEEKRKSLWQL